MPEPILQEQLIHRLVFDKHMTATDASEELKKQGYLVPVDKIRNYKATIHDKKSREAILEYKMENILDSYEKLKIEGSDAFERAKRLADSLEGSGKPADYLATIRELREFITLGLKNLGKLHNQASQITAKNINVMNISDLNQSFKTIVTTWFSDMNAEIKNGKLIFNNPSPELMDDFFRWESKQLKDSVQVDASGTGK